MRISANTRYYCLVAAAILAVTCLASQTNAAVTEVSRSIPVTDNGTYERNPFLSQGGGMYWLFYTQADQSAPAVRPGFDPDADSYTVHYRMAATVADLATAADNVVPGVRPANFSQRCAVGFTDGAGNLVVIASSGQDGTDRSFYRYDFDGVIWTGPTQILDGNAVAISGGHVHATYDGTTIAMVWEENPGLTSLYMESTDFGQTWSVPVTISSDNQPKITKLGSDYYVVSIEDGTGDIEVYNAADTNTASWSHHSTAVPGAGFYDPCIFTDGIDLHVVTAPYDGGQDWQYTVQTRYTGSSWTAARWVSYGGYGATKWWDYWPSGIFDGADFWVACTSEEEDHSLGDGEIVLLQMDWNLDNDHFTDIQTAVDQSTASDDIDVAAGTYREQLTIDKSLNITGAGMGNTILESPEPADRSTYQITQWTGSVRDIDAVVGVNNAGTVNIASLTVDGRETGPDNYYGIHFFDTGGSVTFCRIEDVLYPAQPGAQNVASLVGTQSLGTAFNVDFSDNVVPNFQKGGILVMGPDATFTVEHNLVTNAPSPNNAGNGIQLSYGASGSTFENVVQGVAYTGDDWAATGILLFESGDITLVGDEVSDCQSGVNFSDWGWVHIHPSQVTLVMTDLDLHDNEWTLGTQLSRDGSDLDISITDCQITGSTGDGIDLFGTGEDPWGGSYYTGWENGNLVASISGCTIDNTLGYDGIWTDDSSGNLTNISAIEVHQTSFSNSASSAVNHNLPETMDASACWWDDPAGPTLGTKAAPVPVSGPALISPFGVELPRKGHSIGKEVDASKAGETIYGPVDYSPWLGLPVGSMPMDWFTNDSIQEAIDLAQSGDSIFALAGSYEEQLNIGKDLTITGAGPGATIVLSPTTLTDFFTTSNDNYPIVYIHDATVALNDLTVDGAGRGNSNYRFVGVGFWNADGSVQNLEVLDVRDEPFSGAQHGNGFYSYNDTGGPYTISLTDVQVSGYQKNGVTLLGPGLTVDLDNVTCTGAGPTSVIAQNGIQLGFGSGGSVDDCQVSGHQWLGDTWTSTGMLLTLGVYTAVTNCTSDGDQAGIYIDTTDADVSGCAINGTSIDPAYSGVIVANFGPAKKVRAGRPRVQAATEQGYWQTDKAVQTCTIDDCVITGQGLEFSWGVEMYAADDVDVTVSDCVVTQWEEGFDAYEDGGAITAMCQGNGIFDNDLFGFNSNTVVPADARNCWWGDPSGPYHPTLNPAGLGDEVSDNVLFEPYRTGNIVFDPDPQVIGPDDDIGGGVYEEGVVCTYLGGGEAPVYGYSIDVTWDSGVIVAQPNDFAKPDTGPFANTLFFIVQPITGGVHIDAAVGGSEPGTLMDDLFQATFTAVGTPDYATSDLVLTLVEIRDENNQPLSQFTPDNGLMIVDLSAPVFTSVTITNTTLSHTDDFCKDGDDLLVTTTVTDGDPLLGPANITADLTGLGGGAAVPADSYDGLTATWSVPGINTGMANGDVTVTVTATDNAGNSSGASDDITADNTAPAAMTGLAAGPGHNKVQLAWDDASGNDTYYDGVVIRYAAWGDYPIYATSPPAYPADQDDGDGEAFNGAGTAATQNFTDVERDIYYYSGFVYDIARNYSPAEGGGGNQDRSTSYWLGDVSDGVYGQYDGLVDIADITVLGSTYLLCDDNGSFKDEVDIGPTDDSSRLGIPLPSTCVDFEDLMIMAMNYSVVMPRQAPTTGTQIPLLVWVQKDARSWALRLTEPCANLKGVHLTATLPAEITMTVRAGELLADQPQLVFLRNGGPGWFDTGLAIMGQDVTLAGHGELCHVTFSAPVTLPDLEIEARGLQNESFDIDLQLEGAEEIPVVFQLEQNYPNPFNPMTTISFGLPDNQHVKLMIFTIDGRLVTTLADEDYPAGRHEVIWNGRDNYGRAVASGTYFYRILAGPYTETQKMVLMK